MTKKTCYMLVQCYESARGTHNARMFIQNRQREYTYILDCDCNSIEEAFDAIEKYRQEHKYDYNYKWF